MAAELSIIIVNWNGGALLRRCIESLTRHPPGMSWEIILVDNASTDDSMDWVRSRDLSNVRVIENSENLGFGGANNLAFGLSSAPLLFLLNNDAEVRPGTIDRLIATINSDARVGACGPRVVNPDGTLQVSVLRNPPTPWEMIVTALRLYRLMPRKIRGELLLGHHWDHARRRRVNLLFGAAILVKREVINEVGGFDERFHIYGEDYEWCLRIVRGGWQLVFEPAAIVVHHGGHGTKQRWPERDRLLAQQEAFFLFCRTSLSRWHQLANLVTMYALLLLQLAWRKLTGQEVGEEKLLLRLRSAELKRLVLGSSSVENNASHRPRS